MEKLFALTSFKWRLNVKVIFLCFLAEHRFRSNPDLIACGMCANLGFSEWLTDLILFILEAFERYKVYLALDKLLEDLKSFRKELDFAIVVELG